MQWMPGFDNAALAGTLTVACTLLAALACALNAWRARGGARLLWTALALALLPLAIVEHFDLHLALLDHARGIARYAGRAILVLGAAGVLAMGALALALLLRRRRQVDLGAALALAATEFVGAFVALRAAFFDRIDGLVGFELAGPTSYRVPELVGLALVFLGARISRRRGVAGRATAAPARRSRGS